MTASLLSVSRLTAPSVSEIWRSVPCREGVECTVAGTEIGVEMAVVTLVVASTEVTVSWMVKLVQGGADGEVCEVTVTEVVTAAAATTERSAAAAVTADSRDKISWSEET